MSLPIVGKILRSPIVQKYRLCSNVKIGFRVACTIERDGLDSWAPAYIGAPRSISTNCLPSVPSFSWSLPIGVEDLQVRERLFSTHPTQETWKPRYCHTSHKGKTALHTIIPTGATTVPSRISWSSKYGRYHDEQWASGPPTSPSVR